MRFFNTQHSYYCGVDLHARSMYLHVLDASTPRARLAWNVICPPTLTPSWMPSPPTVRALSPAANASSPGAGSPICARIRKFPSCWAMPCT